MYSTLETIEMAVALLTGTLSSNEARMAMLPANDARSQNSHQMGNVAEHLGSTEVLRQAAHSFATTLLPLDKE
jgi:hypothetical protein